MLSRISCFGKWTVNLHSAHRDRFFTIKVPDKAVYQTGVPSDLDFTVDYSKQLVLGSTSETVQSMNSPPPFRENGGANGLRGLSDRFDAGAI